MKKTIVNADDDNKTGPKPQTVKVSKDWESAVGEALNKEKPAQGWPSPKSKTD